MICWAKSAGTDEGAGKRLGREGTSRLALSRLLRLTSSMLPLVGYGVAGSVRGRSICKALFNCMSKEYIIMGVEN